MLKVRFTSMFKKDYKLIKRQDKDVDKLKSTILKLRNEETLPESMHDHELTGNYRVIGNATSNQIGFLSTASIAGS